ncbi:MAG: SagB/ThcOx family dehydrogenase [Tannerellaceae bacterium]|jgi:SagB-type dehydrogenase family enzyme|nr:SagB/ThcOx family dehydrogenase [Tannerellaceae bacterium]
MRKKYLLLLSLAVAVMAGAQELKTIKLEAPDKSGGIPVFKAFAERKSSREFAEGSLKSKDLSTLLWAANGINRPDGKRTAPSAIDKRDVDIYALMSEGAYVYDPKAHALNPVAAGDYRASVSGGQEFTKAAPLILVLVSDLTRFNASPDDGTKLVGALDIGIVSQNISIACAGLGLATVPRGTMNQAELRAALKLKDTHYLGLNHPVGNMKK